MFWLEGEDLFGSLMFWKIWRNRGNGDIGRKIEIEIEIDIDRKIEIDRDRDRYR